MKLVLLSLLAIAAMAQDQAGRIEGVVQDAASHQPVKKASVSIQFLGPVQGNAPRGPRTITTDGSGTFVFNDLAVGQYQVVVQHQNYPQARMGGARKMVQISATSSTPSVTVELIPGAAISGHIIDEDGDPMNGCIVQPHQAKNPNQGVPVMRAPVTGEDGSYRLYGILPGKYFVSAQCSQSVFQPRPLSDGPDPPPSSAYPMQYYPAASEAKSAQIVELTAGGDKSGIDFQLRPVAVTHIHGTLVAGSADWRGRSDLQIQLAPLDPRGARGFVFNGGAQMNPDGSFDIRQVFPGSYRLMVFSQDFSARGPQSAVSNRVGATLRVDVADKPLDVSLPLHRAMDISGKVEIERGNDNTNPITPSQINLQLMSENQFGAPPTPVQVNDDGTFTVKSVLPGEWRIQLMGPSTFVKSAWLGSDDVTHRPLDLTSGTASSLRVVASTNTGTIAGTAPVGAMVFSAPLDEDGAWQGWRASQTDSNGQFTMPGLPPGKYRVSAGELGAPMPEEGGQEVTVAEGETLMVELKPETKP